MAGVFAYLLAGPAPALGATETDVLANGGFESGAVSWATAASDGHTVVIQDPARARTGSGAAWLGGHNGGSDSLRQSLFIPVTASRATLQFWHRVITENPAAPGEDRLAVRIFDSLGSQVIADVSSRQAAGEWRQSAPVDVTGWRGRSFTLSFQADLDATSVTSFYIDDATLKVEDLGLGSNYTGLWWNPSEPGWGIFFSNQATLLFATLSAHDASGAPFWLVMPAGTRQRAAYTFTGSLYRVTGAPFNTQPFPPVPAENLRIVGTMTASFSGDGTAALSYTVDGTAVTKTITRQVFGARAAVCEFTSAGRDRLANYQDLWWNPKESGWGLGIAHQGDVLFATLFTYDATGRDLWLVMSRGLLQPDGTYLGDLYRATGSPFDANPFKPIGPENLTTVGAMRLQFADGENGTLTYSYDGATVTKAITRQVFAWPLPACAS